MTVSAALKDIEILSPTHHISDGGDVTKLSDRLAVLVGGLLKAFARSLRAVLL